MAERKPSQLSRFLAIFRQNISWDVGHKKNKGFLHTILHLLVIKVFCSIAA